MRAALLRILEAVAVLVLADIARRVLNAWEAEDDEEGDE